MSCKSFRKLFIKKFIIINILWLIRARIAGMIMSAISSTSSTMGKVRVWSVMALMVGSLTAGAGIVKAQATYQSHPPMRPLPVASYRPLASGPAYYVHPKGKNDNNGSVGAPWQTINYAKTRLVPGDTLYLRDGTYYESIVPLSLKGTAAQPITIRSYPGELAIIDAGFSEFYENPTTAWEPVADGAPGEFRSTFAPQTDYRIGGNFADSMVPLHSYKYLSDLRCSNEYWNLPSDSTTQCIYSGPGIWRDGDPTDPTDPNGRIHIRLAHTNRPDLGAQNYQGETDPQKLPLIISGSHGDRIAFQIQNAQYLRFYDVVLRGTSTRTMGVDSSQNLEFDGMTIYGGSPAVHFQHNNDIKMTNSAIRGIAAPWSSRASMKYRGIGITDAYLLIARDEVGSQNKNLEFANNEFTDSHDFFLIAAKNFLFHHNFVQNFNDDGIILSGRDNGGGNVHVNENVHIHQNWISQTHQAIAFSGSPPGTGTYIYRNFIDLRPPVYHSAPESATHETNDDLSLLWIDHGNPVWEPMYFYHNTLLVRNMTQSRLDGDGPFILHYILSVGQSTSNARRRVFNNMFLTVNGIPTLDNPPLNPPTDDFQSDGNLLWSIVEGPNYPRNPITEFQQSADFESSKKQYPPGFEAESMFANPLLISVHPDWQQPINLSLANNSPAKNAGVDLPDEWIDPLRSQDSDRPDIGPLPAEVACWSVGVNGRLSLASAVSPVGTGKR
jgi:hypothetical protein